MKFFKSYIRRNGLNRHPKAKFLALGGVLFSLGVVTSVATTYAWYAINVIQSIPNLNVRIIADEDLDFKFTMDLEKKDGKTRIFYDDRVDEETGEFKGFDLDDMEYDRTNGLNDVSGMYESLWNVSGGDRSTIKPMFQKTYINAPNRERTTDDYASDKSYLQTVLWLKASEDCDIYLTPDSGIKALDPEHQTAAIQHGKDLAKIAKVTNAVRLSFFSDDGYYIAYQPEQTEDEYKGEPRITYFGGVLDMNGDGIYDNDGEKEILYGEYSIDGGKELTYDDDALTGPLYDGQMSGTFSASHAEGIKRVNTKDPNLNIVTEDSLPIYQLQYRADRPLRPLQSICSLKAGEEKRIVFSVYCEGWDRDMTNDIEYASFNINLGFTALLR